MGKCRGEVGRRGKGGDGVEKGWVGLGFGGGRHGLVGWIRVWR